MNAKAPSDIDRCQVEGCPNIRLFGGSYCTTHQDLVVANRKTADAMVGRFVEHTYLGIKGKVEAVDTDDDKGIVYVIVRLTNNQTTHWPSYAVRVLEKR